MCRYGIRKLKTGFYTYEEALDDVMADIFDDDQAVRSLYEYWSNPGQTYHKWGLRQSFDIVASMADGWYKTYFEQLLVILYEYLYLPEKGDGSESDPYRAAITSLLSKVTAVRDHDITHSYAWVRQQANTNLDEYPDIRWGAIPEPDWFANPIAPTHYEFTAYHTAIAADTIREDVLDSNDLILMVGITPKVAETTPATKYQTIGIANFLFIGPGTLAFVEGTNGTPTEGGKTVSKTFGAGMHYVSIDGDYITSWSGGLLFLDTFPQVRKDPDGTGKAHWLYVPSRMDGRVDIESDVRIRLFDQNGMTEIYDYSDPDAAADLGPGQIKVDNANTRGTFYNIGANRYMSPHPEIALLPRTIAEEDFPSRVVINVAT